MAADAFAFHQRITIGNDHIWPRTEEELKTLATEGQLYGAYRSPNDFVGLCYIKDEGGEWELGGLSVEPAAQARGIGTALARIALAHTMAFKEPWKYGNELIAHVHQANEDPRKLLDKLGFAFVKLIEVPAAVAPPSMKRNAEGKIVGDKYRFTREGLQRLAQWFENDSHELFNGSTASINLGPVALDELRAALHDIAERYT